MADDADKKIIKLNVKNKFGNFIGTTNNKAAYTLRTTGFDYQQETRVEKLSESFLEMERFLINRRLSL